VIELTCLRCPAFTKGLLGNKKAMLPCNVTAQFDHLMQPHRSGLDFGTEHFMAPDVE